MLRYFAFDQRAGQGPRGARLVFFSQRTLEIPRMFCNFRLAMTTLVAVAALAASAEAQVEAFKITGGGIAPTGLPLPGQDPRQHWSVGNATHLGKYSGDGSVATESDAFDPDTGTIKGEFGGGSPYIFTAANGDKLVTYYGRVANGAAAPGTFELTIVGFTGNGDLIVTAEFKAEFVVQPESTGKFAGVTGSWIMIADTEPFVLGASDPVAYTWHGEGKLTFSHGRK
jgi:hypothetical protein